MNTSASDLRKLTQRLLRVVLLPAFACALLAAMWTAVLVEVAAERRTSRAEAVLQSQSLARVLSSHVGHVLRQSDHATQLFRLRHEAGGGRYRLAEFQRRGGLFDSVLPVRLEVPMARFDRDGKLADSIHGLSAAMVDLRPFFAGLATDNADAAVFSTPRVDAASHRWQIQVARRLNDAAGRFDGALVMRIDPELFIDDYDRLNLDERGALILMSRSGQLAVGRTGERMFVTDQLRFRKQRAKGAPSDELVPATPLDGIERIYSASDMPRYALTAVVGIDAGLAMARFERHRVQYLGVALLATILIAGISALLMRQSAQLRASIVSARKAQATLRAAAEGSLDGVLILRAWPPRTRAVRDFIIDNINQRGAAMLGLPRSELLGKRAFETLPRYRQAGFFERYAEVYTSGQPLEEEKTMRDEQGVTHWIQHQIVPLQDGVAVTTRDISARKRAEIEIHNNRSFLQSLIEHLPLLIYVKSARSANKGQAMVWNKAAEAMTGYPAQQVIGRPDHAAFPAGSPLCNPQQDQAMLDDPRVIDHQDALLTRPDGSARILHTTWVPLADDQGRTEFILCIAEDVTQRHEQEQSLRASEAHLTAVTNASPLGLVRADMWGNCTYVNKRFETITGLTREEALGHGWLSVFRDESSDYMPAIFAHQRAHEEPFAKITRLTRTDGKHIWASTKIAAIRIDGRIEGFIGTVDDITTLRDAELALRDSEARLRTIADTLPTMVAYIDAAQVYRFHNRAYDQEFGRADVPVLGMTIRDTVGPQRYAVLEPYIRRALAGETLVFEEQDDSPAGERTLEVTYIPQKGDDGDSVVGFHVMRQDITSQQREKKRLLKLAQIDPLTGLANRAGFLQKLTQAMTDTGAAGATMALMYMDIDHFKPVNDTHGHHVGDALLRAFSARLTHTLRASDTVARLGGDEFTIIMEKLGRRADAAVRAEKIVLAMQAPFYLDGIKVHVSASIGVAYFSGGAIEPDALMQEADRLLYQAKQAGRNTFRAAA